MPKSRKCLCFSACPTRSRISIASFSSSQSVIMTLSLWMIGHIAGILLLQCTMTRLILLAGEIFYVVRSVMYCASLVNVSILHNCSSFYGSVIWDLSHLSIDVLCAIWRKGLRPVWNFHMILTVHYYFCCVVYCPWWMNLPIGVPRLLMVT